MKHKKLKDYCLKMIKLGDSKSTVEYHKILDLIETNGNLDKKILEILDVLIDAVESICLECPEELGNEGNLYHGCSACYTYKSKIKLIEKFTGKKWESI